MKRKQKTAFAISVCLVLIVAASLLMLRKPTLEEHATRVMTAALEGDAGLLMRYLDNSEKDRCQITQESLQNFLSSIFLPSIQGYVRHGPITFVHFEEAGGVHAKQVLKRPSGEELSILFTVYETKDGAVASPLIRTLLLTAFYAQDPSALKLTGMDRLRFLLSKVREHRIALDGSGISAVANPIPGKEVEYLSWKEYEDYLESMVE